MTSFENIRVGADVEVCREGYLNPGKVRWKGRIAGKNGNWVGVELDAKVGDHSGMHRGIRYFQCMDRYGIFVRASQIRFPPGKSRSQNLYKTICRVSYIDESLFANKDMIAAGNGSCKPTCIPQNYVTDVSKLNQESRRWNEREYFPLKHPVGGRNLKLGETGIKSLFSIERPGRTKSNTSPGLGRETLKREQLISSPSIPLIHDPRSRAKICW
eukprot:gene10922-12083_t